MVIMLTRLSGTLILQFVGKSVPKDVGDRNNSICREQFCRKEDTDGDRNTTKLMRESPSQLSPIEGNAFFATRGHFSPVDLTSIPRRTGTVWKVDRGEVVKNAFVITS
jgi:hypothetical protein